MCLFVPYVYIYTYIHIYIYIYIYIYILLYAATRGRRVKHPCLTLMHGGSTAHHQAGTTCHIALAVIRRLPVPHNQAMRALLLRRYPLRYVQRRDGSRCTHNS